MQLRYNTGSVKSRIIVIFIAIILVIIGGLTAYWFVNSNQQKDAQTFGNSFITTINDQNISQGYDLIDKKFQNDLGSIYSWANWVSDFKNGNLTIDKNPTSIKRDGINLLNQRFILIYNISNNASLEVDVAYENNSWFVTSYAIR